jgi:hypothetical protein
MGTSDVRLRLHELADGKRLDDIRQAIKTPLEPY